MNKILILTLVILPIVLSQCHNGCATCNGDICLSCSADNSEVEANQRACVCSSGYYASSLTPLTCNQLISGSQEDGCNVEMALNIANFNVNTDCYYYTENAGQSGSEANYIRSDISIDTTHSQFSDANCRANLVTHVQFQPQNNNSGNEDQDYVDLSAPANGGSYLSDLPGGNIGDQRIQIPLIDVYGLAHSQTVSADGNQIVQILNFRILIGFQGTVLRSHRWQSTVFTNRNQVQTFTIDVDIQRTQGCQPGQNCIIVADLDVTGKQYESDWVTENSAAQYTVGDILYLRIWFKDASYTKQLSFQKLYYLNDQNQIFDYTALCDPVATAWNHSDKSLHVQLPLVEPSLSATIQVNMLIETADARLRRLQSSQTPGNSATQQFSLSVSSAPASTSNQTTTNTSKLVFIMLNLLSIIFLI
ncbi:hypothetical protein TTHERM_00437500 (macronuclear) [Tetrahymena thermophila SB210]|uniref:Transmembrane protein n=1 Tax=Tetrahymena thermophila (strain SB210) TaxID=312017 RepID=I7M8A4_TETTS|nr:hypothetical protein TTHERM_00437500 [Tetrahymena thermophila SB210]EAR97501.2 hypothetical protein TTHERM_00437500 [Tetrahymena thermophila SB210]|eukprot:XP_001017746.2 hypothetical protein TTHERM_00437500 [Tetrahymena thermophila SB210]